MSTLTFVVLTLSSTTVADKPVNTAYIVAKSMHFECLDWKIVGLCFWLKCTIFGCYVVTTPKISHRLPDFVVTAYPQSGKSPWLEFNTTFQVATKPLQPILSGGHLSGIGSNKRQQDSVLFNETDVVGNPSSGLLKFGKFLCKSEVTPFFPYFQSLLDASAWRSGYPDVLKSESTTPGQREIGNWPNSTWGSVYPRSGFVTQSDPAKAAAVTSQRAIDIVTGDRNGHIHQANKLKSQFDVRRGNTTSKNEKECKDSGGAWQSDSRNRSAHCVKQVWRQWVESGNENDSNWQMLYPKVSNRCEAFGQEGEWSFGKISERGEYVWNYWRRYKCCIKAGGSLIKSLEF